MLRRGIFSIKSLRSYAATLQPPTTATKVTKWQRTKVTMWNVGAKRTYAVVGAGGAGGSDITAMTSNDFRRAIQVEADAQVNKLVDQLIQAQHAAIKKQKPSFEVILYSVPSEYDLIKIREVFPAPGWHVELLHRQDRNALEYFIQVSLAEVAHNHSSPN